MQHDFDLTTADANTGPTVRAGMNAMAQALATCSSGTTEPSTMYAYQFWADTTSGYMKQRNAANNAWLTRWQLSVGELAALAGATFTGLVNFAAGANIASAATINLTAATGNTVRVTGTTPTSAVTINAGEQVAVVADGAWPLTYNATTNKLNTGGVNYTCAAGDIILYYKEGGVVYGNIIPANGHSPIPIPLKIKAGYFTRDISLTGNQDITGLGFNPRWVILMGAVPGTAIRASWGFSDFTSHTAQLDDTSTSANTYNYSNTQAVLMRNTNATESMATASAISDGFRLAWIKTGSPTGTARMHYMAGE